MSDTFVYTGIWPYRPNEYMSDDVSYPHADKPCTHTRGRVIHCEGSIEISRDGGATWMRHLDSQRAMISAYWSGYCNTGPGLSAGTAEADASSQALQRFATAVREGGRSNFHAMSFLREIGDTYRMVKNPFSLMSALKSVVGNRHRGSPVKDLLRRHRKKVARQLKGTSLVTSVMDEAGRAHLELTYGWRPFVEDCKAIFGGVSRAVEERRKAIKEGQHKRFRCKGSGSDSTSWPMPGKETGWQYVSQGTIKATCSAVVSAVGSVNPTLQSETVTTSLLRATNIDRLGYAVWDAVPYSFVVDWFLPNLGAKLDQAISGPAFYTSVSRPYIGLKTRLVASVGIAGNPRPTTTTFRGGGSFSCERLSFTRSACDVGSLSVTDLEQGMQGTRIASGLALAWGRLRS